MKAELRRLHSPDAPRLESFVPADPSHFGILIQAMIGPKDGPGEESFDFVVCTPSWLSDQVHNGGYVIARHHIVVAGYDLVTLTNVIQELCEEASGPDWTAVATRLARFGKWEFEDYRETGA